MLYQVPHQIKLLCVHIHTGSEEGKLSISVTEQGRRHLLNVMELREIRGSSGLWVAFWGVADGLWTTLHSKTDWR